MHGSSKFSGARASMGLRVLLKLIDVERTKEREKQRVERLGVFASRNELII